MDTVLEEEALAAAGHGPAPPASRSSRDLELLPLDGRLVRLWRASHLIGTAVLLLLALAGVVVLWLNYPAALPWAAAAWLALAALRFWLMAWYPPLAYRAAGYRLDESVLLIRSGVWFQVVHLLPLSRLQHVDLQRGPLERRFGLASLVLHTAGTRDAALTVPGLDAGEAVRLRDHLVATLAGGDDAV
uniref:YdbS-like PH domain-containing protein n=1 Tax=uncultured Armatimonadetes bacterium TaxID=157466 RepID=A0A6J4K3V6_9BACT|nr:hypothetical protein AVDCRST_MAG63-4692 [uncultured Armatimonadetes bacterium]